MSKNNFNTAIYRPCFTIEAIACISDVIKEYKNNNILATLSKELVKSEYGLSAAYNHIADENRLRNKSMAGISVEDLGFTNVEVKALSDKAKLDSMTDKERDDAFNKMFESIKGSK